MYYFHPGRFGLIQSTKGHSVLKKWAYGSRAGGADYDDSYVERYVPTFVPRHYDTGREEREIHRGVDREIIFSDHMMDECYDTARKSHNKDAALLREATAAVVNSETYSDPRAVVASRRAARGHTYYHEPPRYIPPPPQQPQQQPPRTNYPSRRLEKEVVVLLNPYRLRPRPASSYYARVLAKTAMAGRVSLADYQPSPVTRTDLDREMAKRTELIHTIGRPWLYRRPYYSWYPYYSMYRYYRNPYYNYQEKTPRVRVLASPLPQKRKKSLRRNKAALVGSKVDVVLPKRRRPRSVYAQSVMRDIKRQEIAKEEVPSVEVTTGLKAHPRVPARKYRVVYY